jgi:NAD(P)H dehydrogenase (quinone)
MVYAHHEPSSFTAALHNRAEQILRRKGHTIEVVDLYGLGFNPVAEKWDFTTLSGKHFNYASEQERAVKEGWSLSVDIVDQMQKVQAADLIMLHFPLWWGGPPAIMKGWMDRVLAMGFAWDGEHSFATGLLKGKQVFVGVSVGDPQSFYSIDGQYKSTVEQTLFWLLHGTFSYCGFDVHKPFIAHGITISDDAERNQILNRYIKRIEDITERPTFLFKNSLR